MDKPGSQKIATDVIRESLERWKKTGDSKDGERFLAWLSMAALTNPEMFR